jgi:hypothetical protein
MLSYLHPIAAALVLAFLVHIAWLAVRARQDRRRRGALLLRHARLAPWAFALVVVSWVAGLATTWATRPAAELAASGHFRIGALLVALLGAGFATSRWMQVPAVRQLHPWLGAAALLVAAAQVFFGLQILP